MDTPKFNPLIIVTDADVRKTREMCEQTDLNRIRECVDTIMEWYIKQEHFVSKDFSRAMVERMLLLSKGSVEAAKTRIDKLLTYRGMMPELTMKRTVDEFNKFWNCVSYVPLPKLNPSDASRVMVTQFNTPELDEFSLLDYFRYCYLIGEYRVLYDYTVSERYVLDMRNTSISVLTKLNPVLLKKSEVLCTEGFSTKIKGIHILHAPSFVDKLVFIIKQGLKEKVAKRLHVHNSYEDLQKHIARDVLPKDFGGEEESIASLQEKWKKELKRPETQAVISSYDKLVTDESKRSTTKFNEEYLGMPGTFRRLNMD